MGRAFWHYSFTSTKKAKVTPKLKKSWILFGLLAFSTLMSGLFFRLSFGTLFFMLLTGIVGVYLMIKALDKKYPNRWTKMLNHLYRVGLLILGIASIGILIAVTLPQFSCQKLDEAEIQNADYMIVLGAGLKNGNQVSPNLKARLDKSLAILNLNPNLLVVVSGGQGYDETIPEAQAMTTYLKEHGIPENQILQEDHSRSTYQNLKLSKEKLNMLNLISDPSKQKGIFVSQDFHMFRSQMIAKSLDLNVNGICGPTPFLLKINYMVREIPAVMNDALGNVLK